MDSCEVQKIISCLKEGASVIVRVEFFGIVQEGNKRKKMRDYVDIHVGSMKGVKPMFLGWIARSAGIRGNSGIYHPLGKLGNVEIISVEKV